MLSLLSSRVLCTALPSLGLFSEPSGCQKVIHCFAVGTSMCTRAHTSINLCVCEACDSFGPLDNFEQKHLSCETCSDNLKAVRGTESTGFACCIRTILSAHPSRSRSSSAEWLSLESARTAWVYVCARRTVGCVAFSRGCDEFPDNLWAHVLRAHSSLIKPGIPDFKLSEPLSSTRFTGIFTPYILSPL